jgi:hypothetical protein
MTRKRKLSALFILAFLPAVVSAQFVAFAVVGYGFGYNKYHSDELGVFFDTYNAFHGSNLSKPFENKIGMSHGQYWQVGAGIGGEAVQMVVTVEVIKTKTKAIEARFADGTGRDIWMSYRTSNSSVGIRFGDPNKFRVWGQFDMDIGIQVIDINSEYVFKDGSKSFGTDHTLNGRFTNFDFALGLGAEIGVKIVGPLHAVASFHWVAPNSKKSREYHQFTDLQDWNLYQQNFLPRDMDTYINDPTNGSGNSIHYDFRGTRFTVGLQLALGSYGNN